MSGKKRIAIVAFSAPPLSSGGVASAHYNLYQALQKAGLDARLFTFGDAPHSASEANIVRSGSPRWWIAVLRFVNRWIFKLLQPGQRAYQSFDICSAQWGARRMATKIRTWAPDVIILSDHAAPGLALRKLEGVKQILVSHHNPARFIQPPAPDNYSKLDTRLALCWEQQVVDGVDAVVCPSRYMFEFFQQSYRFEGPMLCIPNLLDSQVLKVEGKDDLRQMLGVSKKTALVYLPSAGSQLKGADYLEPLIRSLRQAWNGEIAFYIPGTVEHKYVQIFHRLESTSDIYLPGQLAYEDNFVLARQCDFCISLSLMENYSMALLEAALLGLPILAFDTGGNADIVHEGKNGYLIDMDAVGYLIDRAEAWKDRKTLKTFRQQALAYSRRALDPSIAAQAYVDLVQSL